MSVNRRYGEPILLPDDGRPIRPKRLPFTDKRVDEKNWLQDVIASNHATLPIGEIEPAFAPLILVGMEVPTDVGPIDNLYLNPSGYLTLVETKLWRNAEARREVVGQIIDYAKELSRWSFEDLDKAARDSQQVGDQASPGIIETLRAFEPFDAAEEPRIIDTITRNLQRGRLLLLIVGDGIRESVEAMSEYLGQTPQLQFTLALVELELYEMSLGETHYKMMIPHVVARTQEVTRAVVRVETSGQGAAQVNVETPADTPVAGVRSRLTEDDFFEELSHEAVQEDVEFARAISDDMRERGFMTTWPGASFVVKLADPSGSHPLTLFVVSKDDQVYIGWLASQLESRGLSPEIAYDFARDSADLIDGVSVHSNDKSSWQGTITIGQLRGVYDSFVEIVERTAQKIRDASADALGDSS